MYASCGFYGNLTRVVFVCLKSFSVFHIFIINEKLLVYNMYVKQLFRTEIQQTSLYFPNEELEK